MTITVLYEHPTWSEELLAAFEARDVPVAAVDVGELQFRLPGAFGGPQLWVNRINALPSAGRSPSVNAAAAHSLLALELAGQTVVNGWRANAIGGSKAAQASLFGRLGLDTPGSVAIATPAGALAAAETIGFPILIKPNVGGSGSGIVRFDHGGELAAMVRGGELDLGVDGTAVVQRVIDSADGWVHRVELLGGDLLYGTRQPVAEEGFNYCAVDGMGSDDAAGDGPGDEVGLGPGPGIEIVPPAAEIVVETAAILDAAGCDLGAVEYLIDRSTGRRCYYDLNPYSNFVTGRDDELGFNPTERYVDWVIDRWRGLAGQ